jgi:hypothetical protein
VLTGFDLNSDGRVDPAEVAGTESLPGCPEKHFDKLKKQVAKHLGKKKKDISEAAEKLELKGLKKELAECFGAAAKSLNPRAFRKQEDPAGAFMEHFDLNRDGKATHAEYMGAILASGVPLEDQAVIRQLDKNNDGRVTLAEQKKLKKKKEH